jgi:ribosome maturation factor RimP
LLDITKLGGFLSEFNSAGPDYLEEIKKVASEVAEREGVELYDIELSGAGRHRVLRVTINAVNRPVSIDDCANVSRGLDLVLDVKDIVPGGRYELEVSSPGIERALKTPRHFETALGERIRFHADEPITTVKGIRHSIEGQLKAVNNEQIELVLDGDEGISVPLSQVRKAKVIFQKDKIKKEGSYGR